MYLLLFFFLFFISLLVYHVYFTFKNNNFEKNLELGREIKNKLKEKKEIDPIFNEFPKFYINLDRSLDRKENLEKQVEDYNIKNLNRVKAVDGREITDILEGEIDNIKYKVMSKKRGNYKNSELAITLSHIKAIREGYQKRLDMIMVMEDDIEFSLVPHWKIKFEDLIEMIPEDCDFFLLANRCDKLPTDIKIKKTNSRKDLTGVCYIVTKRGMEKINNMFYEDVLILELSSPIFDIDFLQKFDVYTSNTSFFLLDNLVFDSIHIKNNDTRDSKIKSINILKKYNEQL